MLRTVTAAAAEAAPQLQPTATAAAPALQPQLQLRSYRSSKPGCAASQQLNPPPGSADSLLCKPARADSLSLKGRRLLNKCRKPHFEPVIGTV